MESKRNDHILIALWTAAFLLLLSIFYLTHLIIIDHSGPEKENVEIFTKLPIFLTGIGMMWALLLIIFGYMTVSLKDKLG